MYRSFFKKKLNFYRNEWVNIIEMKNIQKSKILFFQNDRSVDGTKNEKKNVH
jgi:hypothetical protein